MLCQIFDGMNPNKVSNPKTPYEYHKNDIGFYDNELDELKEHIQEQLEADAKHIEYELTKEDSTGCYYLYPSHILRVKIPENYSTEKYGTSAPPTSHGVLSVKQRLMFLKKNMKIPFTVIIHGDATIISYVHNFQPSHS